MAKIQIKIPTKARPIKLPELSDKGAMVTPPTKPKPAPSIQIPTAKAPPILRPEIAKHRPIIEIIPPTDTQGKLITDIVLPPKLHIPDYAELEHLYDTAGNLIHLDIEQLNAVELALLGEIIAIIGKAGTGKTTIVQAICLLWLSRHNWEHIEYRMKGTGMYTAAPSIAVVAFTNQAADNIRNKLIAHPELKAAFGYNVTTIHNLLEYTVEFTYDEEGNKKRRYYPQKDRHNKLQITHLVLEEASQVGVGSASLWLQLFDALPVGVQILFLGDINQLPPIIGKSILSYALQQIKVVELNTVHRCALDNPIIRQAHNCLSGKPVVEDYNSDTKQGVRIFNGKQKIKLSVANYEIAIKRLLEKLINADQYHPMEDMILSPYFKLSESKVITQDGKEKCKETKISAQNLARMVASLIAVRENREVYEIIAGFQTIYLAVGDRVYLNKIEGVVTKIEHNSLYSGKIPKPSSTSMDYWGQIVGADISNGNVEFGDEFDFTSLDIEKMLDTSDEAEEERKRSASHIVHIKPKNFLSEEDEPINTSDHTCSSVGDFASLVLGYALSVHKAQGSEWPNVILALHDSNATLLFRELLYTGMTRARQRLDIIAQQPILEKARINQRIKGDSLAAKIEYFNGGYLDQIVDIIPRGEQE